MPGAIGQRCPAPAVARLCRRVGRQRVPGLDSRTVISDGSARRVDDVCGPRLVRGVGPVLAPGHQVLFFTWCDARGIERAQLSPIAVATYIDDMHGRYRAPTIKQHLAAIRRLFDWLVIGQVVPANPAASVSHLAGKGR